MLPRSFPHAIVGAALLAVLVWRLPTAATAQTRAADLPFKPHPLPRIEPGVQIADRAPSGWSHLVIKSQPKVTSGDVSDVPSMTVRYVSMFFTAIVLKVERQPAADPVRYRLGAVAIGIGTHIHDKDTIISSDSYRSLGADLGIIGGFVLSKSEDQLNQAVEVARSSTMAIVDVPTNLARGKEHVQVVMRHAFLIDPRDGRPYALIWILDKDGAGGYRLDDRSLVMLNPNLVTDCEMRVDASKFFLGTPSPDAFAVVRTPPGTVLTWPAATRMLAAERLFTPASAHELEVGLWGAIFPGTK